MTRQGRLKQIILAVVLVGVAVGGYAFWQDASAAKRVDESAYWPALEAVPSFFEEPYKLNPLPLIRAVNLLQPLGKERALKVIEDYLQSPESPAQKEPTSRYGMFFVLRVLFDVPEDTGRMPGMAVGLIPDNPPDWKLMPRFPIIVHEDIPFLVPTLGIPFGYPQDPLDHVEYFRRFGKLRSAPLVPANDPFQALDRLIKSPSWPSSDAFWEDVPTKLSGQCFRLLGNVERNSASTPEANLRWDRETQTYVTGTRGK